MMVISDPIKWFADNPLEESQVLRFTPAPDRQMVDLVIDYAAESVSTWFAARASGEKLAGLGMPVRDFRHLTFHMVSAMTWPQVRKGLKKIGHEVRSMHRRPCPVITMATVSRHDTYYHLRLRMQEYGPYTFQFGSVTCEQRLGVPIPNSDGRSWRYMDKDTKVEFDFFDPFPA